MIFGDGRPGTVTIAIPTRNRTASLQRLLDSIDRLNYRDFTVLVVDNAPTTDSTYLMVRQRMQSDSQLRYEAERLRKEKEEEEAAAKAKADAADAPPATEDAQPND